MAAMSFAQPSAKPAMLNLGPVGLRQLHMEMEDLRNKLLILPVCACAPAHCLMLCLCSRDRLYGLATLQESSHKGSLSFWASLKWVAVKGSRHCMKLP